MLGRGSMEGSSSGPRTALGGEARDGPPVARSRDDGLGGLSRPVPWAINGRSQTPGYSVLPPGSAGRLGGLSEVSATRGKDGMQVLKRRTR
jgi:hypothetical protein